jgi:uncharacterized repeat protein (TIGR03803 family)
VLHNFNLADGGAPYSGLLVTADGVLFGTTTLGGQGFGTVFRMIPNGTLTTLHSSPCLADSARSKD